MDKLIPFLGAILATAFGFWLNQAWQEAKERRARLKRGIALLAAAEAELGSYEGKLALMVGMLEDFVRANGDLLPSFDFYPAFLEKLKMELIESSETSAMASLIGECEYELAHVQAKLASIRGNMPKGTQFKEPHEFLAAWRLCRKNAEGLLLLSAANRKRFKDAQVTVQAEKAALHARLEGFYDRNVFGPQLRDQE